MAPFDPSQLVAFDLERGVVQLGPLHGGPRDGAQDGASAHAVVPAGELSALFHAAPPAAQEAFGRAVGAAIGARVSARLGAAREEAVETVLEHVGGELALAGFGALTFERWGRALVAGIDVSDAALDDELLAAVLGEILSRVGGRAARVVALGREQERSRFLVTGDAGAARAAGLRASGVAWRDLLGRLHGGAR